MKCLPPSLLTILFLFISISAQNNLIQNGDFSDSNSTAWTINSGDAQAHAAIEMGRYMITIDNPGNSESSPQVLQRGIVLQQNEGYTLTFKVSASDSGQIRAFVMSDGYVLYSDSVQGKVPVTTIGTKYSIDFFVKEYSGNAQVVFNCGLSDDLTRVALDSITLFRKNTPIIAINEPSAQVRWVSGTERHIQWQNSGTLDIVKISFSVDSGATWSTLTDAASNQNNFWWLVPAETSGNNCMIIVSDTSGNIADTSGIFKIVKAGTIDASEMVKNSDFLDTTNWRLSVNTPARAQGSFLNDQFAITIDTIGDEPWQVKLEQPGFTLENGSMYRFSFDAYASHEREIFANVGADNGNPAWSVFGGDSIPVKITTEKTRYYQTIIMKYPTSGNIRIEFNCANDTGTVFIDNVSLIQIEAADVFIFNPSLGAILKSGSKFNIEWHAAEVTTIDLEFSSDSGAEWETLLEGVDNLGIVSWTVPEISSDNCFIRIKDATGDTVIGLSSPFVINKFGAPVKTGELIVNGTFSNYEQGWNTRFDNAQGQPEFRNQKFEITINEPGDAFSSIILSQSDLPVLQGKEYVLSCNVFANGTRSMAVLVISDFDSLALLDTTVSVPSVKKNIAFEFTPEFDAMTRVEFHIGGFRAGVFIDDVSFATKMLPIDQVVISRTKHDSEKFSIHPSGNGIRFIVPDFHGGGGTVAIFNIKGMLLHRFDNAAEQIFWNGTTRNGARAARGNYIARFSKGRNRQIHRFLLNN